MFEVVVLGAPTVIRWCGQRVDLGPMERVARWARDNGVPLIVIFKAL